MTVTKKFGNTFMSIYIDEYLHVSFLYGNLNGIHSWMDSNTSCFIELYLTGGNIKLEYDTIDKWKAVLKILG